MERTCPSCGADPGAGDFCQHCGTRLAGDDATPQPEPTTPVPAGPGSAGPASPTVPIVPQGVAPRRAGCRTGCLVAVAVAIVLLGIGGFFAWRFFDEEVLPGIQETADAFDSLTDVPPGPCYDIATDGGSLTDWTEVSCSGPRQVEVSFAASFEDGPFPGGQYLTDTAAETCVAAFERYVGITPDRSAYDVRWLVPTEDLWNSGQRQGICLVITDDGSPLTGTVKGSQA